MTRVEGHPIVKYSLVKSVNKERQERNRFVRALTAAQIQKGIQGGKIGMGGRELEQEIDEFAAAGNALQSFEDGIYLVLIDGKEQKLLDEQIYLQPNSRITFIRLVMLAEG